MNWALIAQAFVQLAENAGPMIGEVETLFEEFTGKATANPAAPNPPAEHVETVKNAIAQAKAA